MKSSVYIIFGVSGCGKTTVGEELAIQLGIPFYDADDFHPEANIKKMSNGISLNDSDRSPWLEILAQEIQLWQKNKGAVLACSALKEKYREILDSNNEVKVNWVFLDGSYELISERMTSRKGHFFKEAMLRSQFETLERPTKGITVGITQSFSQIVSEIKLKLKM